MTNNSKFNLEYFISKIKENWWKSSLAFFLRGFKDSDIKIFDEYKEIYLYTKSNLQEKILKNIENRIMLKKTLNEIWYHKLFVNDYNLFYEMLYFYEEWYDCFWFNIKTKKHILTWTKYNLEWFYHPNIWDNYNVTIKYWKLNFLNWYNIFWFDEDWIHKTTKSIYDEFWFNFHNFNSDWLYRLTWEKYDNDWYDIDLFNSKWYHKNDTNLLKIINCKRRIIYRRYKR